MPKYRTLGFEASRNSQSSAEELKVKHRGCDGREALVSLFVEVFCLLTREELGRLRETSGRGVIDAAGIATPCFIAYHQLNLFASIAYLWYPIITISSCPNRTVTKNQ